MESRIVYDPKMFIKPEKVPRKYICEICSNVMVEAIQVINGNLAKSACRSCYTQNVKNGVCPFFGTYNTKYYLDNFLNKEIGEFHVVCINKQNGCAWSDRLCYYKAHAQTCDYRLILCKRCEQFVVLFDHRYLQHDQDFGGLACPESTISGSRVEEEEENVDLLTGHMQNYEDLKDSNLMLQDRCNKKDDLIKKLMIEISQLKEENTAQKKNLDEMNNRVRIVMNTMQLYFQ